VEPAPHEQEPAAPGFPCDDRRVGRVSTDERDQIRALYLRRRGLEALFSTLAKMDAETLESTPLYDRIVRDMGVVTVDFDKWWEEMAAKHAWRRQRPDQAFRIDFETCEVFLE